LQVHDVGGDLKDVTGAILDPDPRIPRAPLMRPFEPGQVLTVEPGFYFIDLLLKPLSEGVHRHAVNWNVVEQLKPYGGIRIEDNVLVKADRAENLTRQAFDNQHAESPQRNRNEKE